MRAAIGRWRSSISRARAGSTVSIGCGRQAKRVRDGKHCYNSIGRALSYPKIHRKLKWGEQRIEQFIRQLYMRAEVVDLHSTSVESPRDPQDAHVLAMLIASSADVLVSGDRSLLELRGNYPIQTPAEFVRRL